MHDQARWREGKVPGCILAFGATTANSVDMAQAKASIVVPQKPRWPGAGPT